MFVYLVTLSGLAGLTIFVLMSYGNKEEQNRTKRSTDFHEELDEVFRLHTDLKKSIVPELHRLLPEIPPSVLRNADSLQIMNYMRTHHVIRRRRDSHLPTQENLSDKDLAYLLKLKHAMKKVDDILNPLLTTYAQSRMYDEEGMKIFFRQFQYFLRKNYQNGRFPSLKEITSFILSYMQQQM